jgi:flagellar hook-length control protein FliK
MTKKLEELFNLPESKEIIDQDAVVEKTKAKKEERNQKKALKHLEEIDKISAALPAVKGLGKMADEELNDIANKAIKAYEDLMDLGMNVEPRYSARMFEVAGNMLKTGLDAKTAKLDKKLKMIELQLKKEKQDKEDNRDNGTINGEGYVVTDRNSLLERLKGADKDK